MFWTKISMVILISTWSMSLFAEGAPAKTDEKESLSDKPYSGKQSLEWEKIQTKLSTLKGKLDAELTVLNNLKQQQKKLQGAALMSHIEEVKQAQKKYEAMVDDYKKQEDEFQVKFPEKGLKNPRLYNRGGGATSGSSEEAKLKELQGTILKHYPESAEKIETAKKSAEVIRKNRQSQKSSSKKNRQKGSKKEVTDSITLEK